MGYKDESWLREKYKNRTQEEIADMCGVSRSTITRWMKKHGIETRDGWQQADGDYKDEEWLREKYVEEKRSTQDIADEFGVTKPTVRYWLKKYGIERRDSSEAIKLSWKGDDERRGRIGQIFAEHNSTNHPFLFIDHEGYWGVGASDGNGGSDLVRHNRLLATLLVDDLSELEDKHVHHKDEIPWLDYLDGLEVLTPKEHKQRHV